MAQTDHVVISNVTHDGTEKTHTVAARCRLINIHALNGNVTLAFEPSGTTRTIAAGASVTFRDKNLSEYSLYLDGATGTTSEITEITEEL